MSHTSLAVRLADFLKNYPPFEFIPNDRLQIIAQHAKVVYLKKNQTLFKFNDSLHPYFYIIKEGAVGLLITSDMEESLIDKCDEGDVLGLRPFFAKNNYLMTAKAREESLLYAIPIGIFKPYVIEFPKVMDFLLESFASNTRNPLDKNNKGKLIAENVVYNEQQAEIQYYQPIKYTKNPIIASADEIVKSVAKTMTTHRIGSVLIHKNYIPVGIVTDKDLRSKIATGLFDISVPVSEIMSSPVITVPENISIAETQLLLLQHNIRHLCVTEDGTIKTKIRGIISEHDVIVAQANNPAVLLKQIKRAQTALDLKKTREKWSELIHNSIEKNIPIEHISSLTAALNNAMVNRCIQISISAMQEEPPAKFAWFSIGSQGRREQLLLSDQDNALIFEDVIEENYDYVKSYFLRLATRVNDQLEIIGYEKCPANMMAGNPNWCLSLSEWIQQFGDWIQKPGEKGILMCSIFFDFDCVAGDNELMEILTKSIFEKTQKNDLFLAYLGADALKNPPPLGFFRQFLVESDGDYKDTFDVKSRAILPLVDAARLLSLQTGIKGVNNTFLRYKKLAELEPQNADIFEACAEAFNTLSKFRTAEGIMSNSSGRFLNLNDLSKSDKVKLKNTFVPIQEIQEIIKNRFQLTYFI
jgi:CBS domain-containing protein